MNENAKREEKNIWLCGKKATGILFVEKNRFKSVVLVIFSVFGNIGSVQEVANVQ